MFRLGMVMNRKAGSALGQSTRETAARVRTALEPLGPVVVERIVSGRDLPESIRLVAGDPEVDVIVAAGGDGTVSLAARHAVAAGKRLLPIPLGTFNLFSRTLGWGGDPAAALAMLGEAEPATVDVGVVNDLVFVHHVSLGLHPRYVRMRDAIPFRSRLGKITAAVRALSRTIRTTRTRRVSIDTGTGPFDRRALGLAVTVNRIAEVSGELPTPVDPEGGLLAVYIARADTLLLRLLLVVNAFRGRWHNNAGIEALAVTHVKILINHPTISVALDGELVRLTPPLEISIHRQALKVLRRRDPDQPAHAPHREPGGGEV